MTIAHRSTLVVHGRLAMRESRLAASRDSRHGLQVLSFEQAAVRLAGGFVRPIDDESLRAARRAPRLYSTAKARRAARGAN